MEEVENVWFEKGLKFKCTECGQCCTGSPGYVYLSQKDIEELSSFLNISKEAFLKKYARFEDQSYVLLEDSVSYDCVFLKNSRCSVYEARPVQCKTFPWWLGNLRSPKDWEEAKTRCEGIDHPEAPLIDSSYIQKELSSYIDSLIEENFDVSL